jgi:hypothetical protein
MDPELTIEQTNAIIKNHVVYNSALRLVICHPCGKAFPSNIYEHLLHYHGYLSLSKRKAIENHIKSLNYRTAKEVAREFSSDQEVDAIDGLMIIKAFQCLQCHIILGEKAIAIHCNTKHGWKIAQSIITRYNC